MGQGEENTDAALETMRRWQWLLCDPDGNEFHPAKELANIISRLAMEGISRPDGAVMKLLLRGDLVSRGDFCWRKFEANEYFQLEGIGSEIPLRQWKSLREVMLDENSERDIFFDLENINLLKCQSYEWKFGDNRFSYARRDRKLSRDHPKYYEEWYSAWGIQVWPSFSEQDEFGATSEVPAPPANKGGRPPAADWEAAALVMAGRYYRGDLKPATIADVGRALRDWLAERDLYPSESILRSHAKLIFESFQQWEQE